MAALEKVNGLTTNSMANVILYGLMAMNLKVNACMEKNTVKDL